MFQYVYFCFGMRRVILFFLLKTLWLLPLVSGIFAQVKVSDSLSAPAPSAMLEIESVQRGFLPPRMNSHQRDAVVQPAVGLMIYNTDNHCPEFFDGFQWRSLCGPWSCGQPFTDSRDSNVYQTVQIGSQCWMRENLRYLPAVNDTGTGSYTDPHYYVQGYSGNLVQQAKQSIGYMQYGVYYNWAGAMQGAASSNTLPGNVQGPCPSGWHLPSSLDFHVLVNYIDPTISVSTSTGWVGTDGGTKLKSVQGWLQNGNGTNAFGFTGLSAGNRDVTGPIIFLGEKGRWWTSLESSGTTHAVRYGVDDIEARVARGGGHKIYGYSVRCVRNP